MADTPGGAGPGDAYATVQFSIEKIYVKDLSLENPGAPKSFQITEAPQIEIGLRTRGEQVEQDVYECVLTLTVTARTGDQTVFLVEASQAGVFGIRGVSPDQLQPVLAVHCPAVPGWQWNGIVRSGDVIDAIVQMASAMATPLIVMATDGRHGFLDALRGSHSERVLRRTPCPLLAIPVEAAAAPRLSAS